MADVPVDVYGERALAGGGTDEHGGAGRLKDVEWVSAVGLAHQAVVDACLRSDAVVPMKLFTIFANDTRAIDAMTRQMRILDAAIERVAGCGEWGVRVTRAEAPHAVATRTTPLPLPAPAPAPNATATPAAAAAAGRAFLEAKAQQRRAVRDAAVALDQDLRDLAATLHDLTRDVRYRDNAGIGAPPLLDAACLVARDNESRFRTHLRAKARPLLARGCRVTVTGPWPPYSFVSPASA